MSDKPTSGSGTELVFAVLGWLFSLLWRYRTELLVYGLPFLAYLEVTAHLGRPGGLGAVTVLVLPALLVPRARRRLGALLSRAAWRRRIEQAIKHLAPRLLGDRRPVVGKIAVGDSAVRVGLRLVPGHTPAQLEAAAEALAAATRVAEVRVERERADASVVYLTFVLTYPFAGAAIACPWTQAASTSLWGEVPIGVDETGRAVRLGLAERNLLVGGEPGAGKSALIQQVAAFCALDPSASLYLLDPKIVELSRWAGVAAGFAGAELDDAIEVLCCLDAEMTRRYAYLAAHHKRKVTAQDGLGLKVLLVDELMIYLTGEKRRAAELASLLRRLVALGRAAGIVCVLATQKPSVDVVPSSIRDNVAYRVAFRTTTREASDTILGAGWAASGHSSAEIDAGTPGVCLLLDEGATPRRLRSYYLSDEDLDAVVARATVLRHGAPTYGSLEQEAPGDGTPGDGAAER